MDEILRVRVLVLEREVRLMNRALARKNRKLKRQYDQLRHYSLMDKLRAQALAQPDQNTLAKGPLP